ncbi:MAG: TonB-dependent receptor [Rhodothermaceae bacterium]
MKKVLLFCIAIFITTLTFNNSNAQDVKQVNLKDSVIVTAEKNLPVPQVSSIATKLFIPLKDIPLSVSVVNNSLINNQNNLVLGDALRNIAGVNTQTGNGVHDYFIIRGMNSLENSLILTDGTLEPEVTYYNLYNVERVEVLKGPGAFLYGSNPLSGTVNLVRKQPQFRNFVNLQSSYGAFNSVRNSIDAGYGSTETGLAARINLLWEDADNYRDDKENEILAINPSVTYFAGKDLTFNLNFEYINSKYKPDAGIPLVADNTTFQLNKIADVDRKTSFQTPIDYSDQKIIRAKLYTDYKISENVTFSNKMYYSQLDWKSTGTLLNGAYPTQAGTIVVRSMSKLDDVRDLFGMQNEFSFKFNTGKITHKVIAGFEWSVLKEEYSYDVATVIPPVSLTNPVNQPADYNALMSPYLAGDVTNTVFAPYIIDHIKFSDKLQMIIGMRYDIINFENKAKNYLADREYDNLSPLAGITYSIVKNVSLYANIGQAYAPPSSQVIGDDREAERSTQYEFGVKQKFFDGRLNVDVAYYHLEKDDISIPSADGLSRQQGDMLSKGVEVEIRMEPLENLFTFISYAYSDAKMTKFNELIRSQVGNGQSVSFIANRDGNRPAFAPEHLLNIWCTKEFSNGIGIGGGVRYIDNQYIHINNAFELDTAFLVDAIVYYKWNKFKFTVNFKNITDKEYEMRGFGASSVIPAAPRSVYGKINLSL